MRRLLRVKFIIPLNSHSLPRRRGDPDSADGLPDGRRMPGAGAVARAPFVFSAIGTAGYRRLAAPSGSARGSVSFGPCAEASRRGANRVYRLRRFFFASTMLGSPAGFGGGSGAGRWGRRFQLIEDRPQVSDAR
jgi:hypothetical protein